MAYKMHMWLRKDMKYAGTNLPKRNIKFLMQEQKQKNLISRKTMKQKLCKNNG